MKDDMAKTDSHIPLLSLSDPMYELKLFTATGTQIYISYPLVMSFM